MSYVVVTGSSGKLGKAAVTALRQAGHRVVGLDLDTALTGHHRMIVAAADTLIDTPSAEPMAEHFPDVPLRALAGNQSLLSSARAGELIGYVPKISWRDRVEG